MTPKEVRDLFKDSLIGNTSAGQKVYSGRYLPHVVNNLQDTTDKKFIDINIYNRAYQNYHPRDIGTLGTVEVNLDCIVIVSDNVMDVVDAFIEEIKDSLFSETGLLNSSCDDFVSGIVSIEEWNESITINIESDKQFVIGTMVFTLILS